jgi:F-type H+-transporting ATPase subunit delta
VSVQSSARRYAQALHQVATRNGSIEAVSRDLASLLQALDAHADLDAVFRTPLVAPRRKRALVEALLSSAPGTTGEVSRLLLLLAERDRLAVLREIAAAYDARVNAAGRMASAEIVTAVPLDRGRQTQLAQALGHATGQHVTITNTIDPSIVGGVVARVGGVVYDGSVVRQLERMRQKLVADA